MKPQSAASYGARPAKSVSRFCADLQRGGLSRRAAQEALGADPRDLSVNLKKLLQNSQTETFQEQTAP